MALAAVDALQHVNVAMVQPQFQISRNTHRAGELLCVRKSSLSLTEQTHSEAQMLKTLMMSAAVSTLMVSGALAQANPPAAPPAAPAAKADAAPVDSAKFIQAQGTDQWVFSKFKGTDVIGPDNAQVGDGGFLGIGEKSVAIDMSAFQPVPADTGSSTAGGNSAVSSSNDPTNVKLKVSWTKDQLKSAPDFQYYKAPARTTERPAASPTTGMAPRPATPGADR